MLLFSFLGLQFIHRQVYYNMEPQSQQLHIIKKIKNRQKRRLFYLRQGKLLLQYTILWKREKLLVCWLRCWLLCIVNGRGIVMMVVVTTKTGAKLSWLFFCYCVYYIPPHFGCERTNSAQKSAKLFRIYSCEPWHFNLLPNMLYMRCGDIVAACGCIKQN